MKSSRRHELQQNALRNELLKTWDLLRAKGNMIAWGALIIAVIVFAIFYFTTESRKKAARIQADYAKAVSQAPGGDERIEALKTLADKDSPEWLAAGANVEVGNEYAFRLTLNWGKLSEAERKQLADNARTYFQRAIDRFAKQDIAVAKAHLGLGKIDENFADYDNAKNEYQAVRQMGETPKGNPILVIAEEDYNRITDLFTGKVRMATTAPAEEPASQPTTASAPALPEPSPSPSASPASEPAATPAATPVATPSPNPATSATAPVMAPPASAPADAKATPKPAPATAPKTFD